MGDSNVPITAGSGTNISTRTNASGEHLQVVMLGRDGNDGVLDPAALADALANPTTLTLGALGLVYAPSGGTAQWDRLRTPNVFKTVSLSSGTAETTIWTPASGRKFRLMGFWFKVGSTAAVLTFKDGSGGATIFVGGATGNDNTGAVNLGNGILSAAANNVLTVTRSGSTTLDGTVWGVEE